MNAKNIIKKIIPGFLLSFYHYLLSAAGAFLYGFSSKRIKVIGVTGTKGKSTTVDLICRIFEEEGYKVASISSIRFKIKEKVWQNRLKMAMPGRFKIQRFLKKAVTDNCQYAVLEVSSEGIKQHRHRFITFEAAVFTNLSPEHIEAHKGFENYRKAKLGLFRKTNNIHIINLDDENTRYFKGLSLKKEYGYTINGKEKTSSNAIKCLLISLNERNAVFEVKGVQFNLNLLGKFNVYNALAAISVGLSQGISLETSKKALEKVKRISGRMEVIINRPVIIVDYAHTPDSLEKVYQIFKGRSLICVLGSCGGGRDKWKRPVLGRIADQYCKEVIITNEDPYDEDPMEIIEQVAQGLKRSRKILDRREAIKEAINLAQPDDVVIITGKGSEPWMCLKGGKKIPWDDREVVREEFGKKTY